MEFREGVLLWLFEPNRVRKYEATENRWVDIGHDEGNTNLLKTLTMSIHPQNYWRYKAITEIIKKEFYNEVLEEEK